MPKIAQQGIMRGIMAIVEPSQGNPPRARRDQAVKMAPSIKNTARRRGKARPVRADPPLALSPNQSGQVLPEMILPVEDPRRLDRKGAPAATDGMRCGYSQ